MLYALDVSAMLSLPSETEGKDSLVAKTRTPVTGLLPYSELSKPQIARLHPIPTKEKVELAYSEEALGFLGREDVHFCGETMVRLHFSDMGNLFRGKATRFNGGAMARLYFNMSNLFQAQFFNVFSAEEANRVAKDAFDSHVAQNRSWMSSIVGYFSGSSQGATFREMRKETLSSLFFAGFNSLSDDSQTRELFQQNIKQVKTQLSENKQPYFNAVVRYLYRSVQEALNYERFKRVPGLNERIREVNELFNRYGVVDTASVGNALVARRRRQSFVLDGYRPIFTEEEWEALNECSGETKKEAVIIRTADMAGIAMMKAVEATEKISELENSLERDRKTAREVVTELQDQLETQKEETNAQKEKNQSLEERIYALEAAAAKQKIEEKKLSATMPQEPPEKGDIQETVQLKQTNAETNVGGGVDPKKGFCLGRCHYDGETKEINGRLYAEGLGCFKAGLLFIKGIFLQNRLNLSDAEISTQSRNVVIGLNMSGYFPMEKIKNFRLVDIDRRQKKVWFGMPDGSKYIFSPNLIQFVTKDGQISEFIAER